MEELTILNPFVVGKYVSPHFFCDREVETQWLMKQIANGSERPLSYGLCRCLCQLFLDGICLFSRKSDTGAGQKG